MGFFNGMNCISQMNGLLSRMEMQVQRVIAMKESNYSEEVLQPEMRVIGAMYHEAQSILENSSLARSATYVCMGTKMQGRNVPEFIKASMLTLTYMY